MTEHDVRTMHQVAYLMSQTVAALCRLEGMKTLNAERARKNQSGAYTEKDFEAVIGDFGLWHNTVVETLNV